MKRFHDGDNAGEITIYDNTILAQQFSCILDDDEDDSNAFLLTLPSCSS